MSSDPYAPIDITIPKKVINRNLKPRQRTQLGSDVSKEDSMYYNSFEGAIGGRNIQQNRSSSIAQVRDIPAQIKKQTSELIHAVSEPQNVYRDTRDGHVNPRKPEHDQIKIKRRAENQSNVQIVPLKREKASRVSSIKDSGMKEPLARELEPIAQPVAKKPRVHSPNDRFKLP